MENIWQKSWNRLDRLFQKYSKRLFDLFFEDGSEEKKKAELAKDLVWEAMDILMSDDSQRAATFDAEAASRWEAAGFSLSDPIWKEISAEEEAKTKDEVKAVMVKIDIKSAREAVNVLYHNAYYNPGKRDAFYKAERLLKDIIKADGEVEKATADAFKKAIGCR